jgi:uncharacterized protein
MKYLIIFVLLLAVFGLWRNNKTRRNAKQAEPQRPPTTQMQATEVISCSVCSVHLPRAEALMGKKGHYCSHAHRLKAGDG